MGYTLLGNFQNLPQVTLEARSRSTSPDPNSPFENDGNIIVYTSKTITKCSVQPLTSSAAKNYEQSLGIEGLKNNEAYHLFCADKLIVGIEGTGIQSDQVLLDSVTGLQLWFTVIRSLNHPYTGVARYKYLVVLNTNQLTTQ